MNRTVVAVEEVRALQARRREINRINLKNIVWTENGEVLEVPPEEIDDWSFTGLNNVDFVGSYFDGDGKVTIMEISKEGEK